jgi:ERCC4-type nuclease
MIVVIDSKEKKIQKELENLKFKFKIKTLKLGDIIFVKDKIVYVVIERKTVSDFISSTKTDRKKDQIWRLKNSTKNAKPYYLIEGDVKDIKNKKILETGIVNIELRDCIPVHRTNNVHESALLIIRIKKVLEKYGKPNSTKISRSESLCGIKKNSTINKNVFFEVTLTFIPGIGPKTAKKISTIYSSYREIYDDQGKKLDDIKIGQKIKNRLIKYLNLF